MKYTAEMIEEINSLIDMVGVVLPIRIKNPKDFLKYMLRVDKNPEEISGRTILVLEPGSDFEFKLDPDDDQLRSDLYNDWARFIENDKIYVCVNIEPHAELNKAFKNRFNQLDRKTIVEFTRVLTAKVLESYIPSFRPYAIVWHTKQLTEDGQYRLPVHANLFFESKQMPTKEEFDIISEEIESEG